MPAMITVRSLSLEVGVDCRVIRGVAVGIGAELVRTSAADLLSETDANRVKSVVEGSALMTSPASARGNRRSKPASPVTR
jgi:hypothetical protein